jgi:hypothetical protein
LVLTHINVIVIVLLLSILLVSLLGSVWLRLTIGYIIISVIIILLLLFFMERIGSLKIHEVSS